MYSHAERDLSQYDGIQIPQLKVHRELPSFQLCQAPMGCSDRFVRRNHVVYIIAEAL